MTIRRPVAIVTDSCCECSVVIAVELAARGFDLALIDSRSDGAQEIIEAVCAHDGLATVHRADMADVSGHDRLLDQIVSESGPIACLVHHGVPGDVLGADPLAIELSAFDRLLGHDLRGTFFFTQATARHMVDSPAGMPRSIITIAADGSWQDDAGRACELLSASSRALTSMFARRLAPFEIGVFEVRPRRTGAPVPCSIGDAASPSRSRRWQPLALAVGAVATRQLPLSSGGAIDVDVASSTEGADVRRWNCQPGRVTTV